jgi:dTDP-4-dehydrorhamnose reductase
MTSDKVIHALQFGQSGQLASALIGAAAPHVKITPVPRSEVDFFVPNAAARRIENEGRVDVVVNAVAYTGVDQAEREPGLAQAVNAIAPGLIAQSCAQRGIPLVHVSTDYVFDGSKPSAYVETDPVSPINMYGQTKCHGEDLIRTAWARHVIIRTSWLYAAQGTNFVKTILRLAASRDELKVVNDQWGNPTSARDLADAILSVVRHITAAPGANSWGTFHYAGAGRTNWCHFAETIVEEAEKVTPKMARIVPIPSSEFPTAARRPKNSTLDCTKLETIYGISPRPWFESVKTVMHDILTQ